MTPAEPRRPGLVGSATQLLFRQATRLPLTAVSMGLQAWEGSRGLRDTARRHGAEVLQIAAHTPLGRFLPKEVLDDGAEEEAARIVQDARNNVLSPIAAGRAEVAGGAPGRVRAAPRGAARAPRAAREAGAPGVAAPVAEKISEQLDIDEPSRDELPIPD